MVGTYREEGRQFANKENIYIYIYRGKAGGKRCVRRPRKKWMEDVEEDIKMMGIRCWRRRAQDREEWFPVVRQALALEGP